MRRLAQNPSSEVIVTFMPKHFMRFVSQMDDNVDAVFGHSGRWRDFTSCGTGSEKQMFLLARYRDMLKQAGFQYLLDFELVTRKGESLYIVFGTNHRRGLEKMKESVWEVDKLQGVGYRDPNDLRQETLFDLDAPALRPLEGLLLSQLSTAGKTRVEDLRNFALFNTVYREQHVIPALTALRDKLVITTDTTQIRRASHVWKTTSQSG